MAPVSRHCDDADAFASYDAGGGSDGDDTATNMGTAWLVVGRYQSDPKAGPNRTVHMQLSGLPAGLVSGGQTAVTLAKIPNRLQLAVPHPVPMGRSVLNVTRSAISGFDLDLQLPIGTHDVWTVRVLRPSE